MHITIIDKIWPLSSTFAPQRIRDMGLWVLFRVSVFQLPSNLSALSMEKSQICLLSGQAEIMAYNMNEVCLETFLCPDIPFSFDDLLQSFRQESSQGHLTLTSILISRNRKGWHAWLRTKSQAMHKHELKMGLYSPMKRLCECVPNYLRVNASSQCSRCKTVKHLDH